MSDISAGQDLELDILDLAAGGRGLGRAEDGRVVFVAGALTGERVTAHVTRVKRDYAEAQAVDILRASPQRVEPACPLYGRCGGCDLMHLDYPAQVEAKAAWVRRALWRLDLLPEARVLASPLAWGFRNRLRLQVQEGRVGFFARGGHQLVEVAACPVAAPAANALLPGLAAALGRPEWSGLAWVEVLADESQAFLTLGWQGGGDPPSLAGLAQEVGAQGARLCRGEELAGWPLGPEGGLVYHQEAGLTLRAYPGVFCQVNFAANRLLLDEVAAAAAELRAALAPPEEAAPVEREALEAATAPAGLEALDLYAGAGNLGLPLAAAGWRVLAVEGDQEACRAAVVQAHQAGLQERYMVQAAEVGQALAGLGRAGRGFDLVLLDPPRGGAKDLMPGLLELQPARVVYVSCHPAALARDAAMLVGAGYRPNGLTVLDFFPHTGHVEAVLVLDAQA
ncbi:MAG: class I SAM-dependent RNA methyltransferase [Desulfarculus sp.]|nr:class I SAM-dependent RNA methyltransferase [Desulfarculus sp.]